MKKNTLLIFLGIMQACLFAASAAAAPQATGARRPLLEGAPADIVPWVTDPNDTDTFTFQVLTQPTNGTAAAVSSSEQLEYTPNAAFTSGTDSYNYSATDQNGNSVNGKARVRVYDAASALVKCTRNGTLNTDGSLAARTKSNDCTFYSRRRTRTAAGSAVTMDFFINWPSDSSVAPKGIVVLIGGGDFNMNFSGDTVNGVPDETGGGNFVVRTAQLFADAGYITIAPNKPSDLPTSGTVCAPSGPNDPCQIQSDEYRAGTKHTVDILKILKRVNTLNLPVFLAGTSKGALSAMAQNLIATGISLSSPVTNNTGSTSYLYAGQTTVATLRADFVKRPVHVLWNTNDLCSFSPPSGSQSLFNSLSLTTSALSSTVTSTMAVTTPNSNLSSDNIGPCQAFDIHGYFGIEDTAVATITSWLDARVNDLAGTAPPNAPFGKAQVASGGTRNFNLANITGNPTGVTYGLSSGLSALNGIVTISGSKVKYKAPPGVSNETDYFVYTVIGPQGAVGAGIITIKIGN
jgi:hypothetical protein